MAKKTESNQLMTLEYLNEHARFLYIVLPYYDDEKENLINFYDENKKHLESEPDFANLMLNKEHKLLTLIIDLHALNVPGWNGRYLRMWGKIRGYAYYTLLDANMKSIWQLKGYVPGKLLPPYEDGWGEYLELVIEPDGSLKKWRTPLDFSEFIERGRKPEPIPTNRWYKTKWAYWEIKDRKLDKDETRLLIKFLKRSIEEE